MQSATSLMGHLLLGSSRNFEMTREKGWQLPLVSSASKLVRFRARFADAPSCGGISLLARLRRRLGLRVVGVRGWRQQRARLGRVEEVGRGSIIVLLFDPRQIGRRRRHGPNSRFPPEADIFFTFADPNSRFLAQSMWFQER